MIRMERTVLIQRPIEAVYAYVTDMEKVRTWLPVSNIRPLTAGPIGLHSAYKQTAEFMGQSFDSTIKITRYEPPHAFAFEMIEGPFPLTTTMIFVSAGESATTLTTVGEANPGSALKFLGPLVTPLVRKQLETQVTQLKKVLEL